LYYYGPHMGGDKHARERFRGHPWFDAAVEFCGGTTRTASTRTMTGCRLRHFAPAVEEVFTREPVFY